MWLVSLTTAITSRFNSQSCSTPKLWVEKSLFHVLWMWFFSALKIIKMRVQVMDKRKYLNEIFYKNEFKDSKSSFLLISFLRMCVTAAPRMFLKRLITCQSSLSEWMASGVCSWCTCTSSHRTWSIKKAVFKNVAIFTRKHLWWCLLLINLAATLLKKRLQRLYYEKHLQTTATASFNDRSWMSPALK